MSFVHLFTVDDDEPDPTPGQPMESCCGARTEYPVQTEETAQAPVCHDCVHELMSDYGRIRVAFADVELRLSGIQTIANPDYCVHSIEVNGHDLDEGDD